MGLILSQRKSRPSAGWPREKMSDKTVLLDGRVFLGPREAGSPLRGWFLLVAMSVLCMLVTTAGATAYRSSRSLSRHLAVVAKEHPDLVRVCRVGLAPPSLIGGLKPTLPKRKVWLVEVGQGAEADRKTRPAILLVAGIEGNDLIGCSSAVLWVERLVQQYPTCSDITKLLDTTTIYVIPRLNADAAEHFFSKPKSETSLNDKPVDDDHDGLVDEDGPEDLNGDGLITQMRVEDPEGEYILDPTDDRLLVKADHTKGEVGRWRYLTEGIDNDHDEQWNEDGPGGVNFNRNFPYNYEFFASDAGLHQVSEAETRALAEFVIGHPNIGIVVTYGAADNLVKTPAAAPIAPAPSGQGRSRGRKPTLAIDQNDLPYYQAMGEKYRESLGLKKELEGVSVPGTFSDWMYFHRGRLSLAARPWSPALAIELSKAGQTKEKTDPRFRGDKLAPAEAGGDKKVSDKSKTDQDERNEEQRKELKWFDEHAPEAFIRWQPIQHPDFPGQRVEVGGYHPFSHTNPPCGMIEDIAAKHADFLTEVAQQLPRIGVRKVESKHLGKNVYEIKIQVENTGFLPTSLSHGQTTREVYPTRIIMELDNERFLSGSRTTNLPTIQGSGGMSEVRYVIHAPNCDRIKFKVVSMLAGQVEGTIHLVPDSVSQPGDALRQWQDNPPAIFDFRSPIADLQIKISNLKSQISNPVDSPSGDALRQAADPAEHTFPGLGVSAEQKVPVAWNRYYDHAGLGAILARLNRAFPELTKLYSIGKSYQGRDVWCLEVTARNVGDPNRKPAMYIDGNIHGNEIQAGEVVAYTGWYLCHQYGRLEKITALLNDRVFYLLPTINPDGRDFWIHGGQFARSGLAPTDNDRDGLMDEDDCEDLNGDGFITLMRKKDPQGRFKLHPDYPKYLMVRAKPDEPGKFSLLGWEGIDNDGDGRINEDGPGGYDLNRNWAYDWQPNYIQYGAKDYPFSQPETRAVAEFVLAHPNIAASQSYHNAGGMILRSPGREGGPMADQDEQVLKIIAERGEKILPFYRSMITWKDLYTVWGGEDDWFYAGRGVLSFTNELWTPKNLYKTPDPPSDEDEAAFIEYVLLGDGAIPWQEYDHPTYGKIEIGGQKKQWGHIPPSFLLEEELHRNMAFTLYHAEMMPLLRIGDIEIEKLADSLFKIWVTVENHRLIPTRTAQDVANHISPPDVVSIQGDELNVLSAGRVTDRFFKRATAVKRRPHRVELDTIAGMSAVQVQFVVSGTGSFTVTVDSAKGGVLTKSSTLP